MVEGGPGRLKSGEPSRLTAVGISEVEILNGAALNRLYFDGRSDGLRLAGASRIARPRV